MSRSAATNPVWTGDAAGAPPDQRCGDCDWHYRGGRGAPVSRCRRLDGVRIEAGWPACPAFVAELDCQTCGACCREAYDAVEISARDPFRKAHPELVVQHEGRLGVRRAGPWCAALGQENGRFACAVYEQRPQCCRGFERGSTNCVHARRRVGLTP